MEDRSVSGVGLRTSAALEVGMIVQLRIGNETHSATVIRCSSLAGQRFVGLRFGTVGDAEA